MTTTVVILSKHDRIVRFPFLVQTDWNLEWRKEAGQLPGSTPGPRLETPGG